MGASVCRVFNPLQYEHPFMCRVARPVAGAGRAGSRQLRDASAAVLFLRNQSLRLSEIGALDATLNTGSINDGCRVSCVD